MTDSIVVNLSSTPEEAESVADLKRAIEEHDAASSAAKAIDDMMDGLDYLQHAAKPHEMDLIVDLLPTMSWGLRYCVMQTLLYRFALEISINQKWLDYFSKVQAEYLKINNAVTLARYSDIRKKKHEQDLKNNPYPHPGYVG